MPSWIENLPFPQWFKNALAVAVIAVVATTVMMGHANDIKAKVESAEVEAKDAARAARETAAKVTGHEIRILSLESYAKRSEHEEKETKLERKDINRRLGELQTKIAAMDGKQEVQTKVILEAIKRIENKVDGR